MSHFSYIGFKHNLMVNNKIYFKKGAGENLIKKIEFIYKNIDSNIFMILSQNY